jgi:hypothetical protein
MWPRLRAATMAQGGGWPDPVQPSIRRCKRSYPMFRPACVTALCSVLILTACEDMTREETMVVGGLTGAALGVVTAKALDADNDWKIIGGLAGAAAGVLVARNAARDECAYSRGDGTYVIRPCP